MPGPQLLPRGLHRLRQSRGPAQRRARGDRRRRRRASPHGREPHPPRRGSQPAAAPVAGRGNPRGHEDRRRPRSPPLPGRLSRHRPGHSSGPGRRRAGAPGASRPATPRSSPGRRRCAEAMSRSGSGASSTSSGRRSYCAGPRTSSTWPSCTSGSPSLLPGRNPSLTTPSDSGRVQDPARILVTGPLGRWLRCPRLPLQQEQPSDLLLLGQTPELGRGRDRAGRRPGRRDR